MLPDDISEKLDLLINDENRIVTYKILSHELKIHVNKAKQYLMDFFNDQKSKGIDLKVHYFLAGYIERDGVHAVKVLVVPEENLENAKSNFKEITSFHIYSIYKGATKDECALYSADFTYVKDKKEQNKYSAIKHPNIEIRPPVLSKIQLNNDMKSSLIKKVPCASADKSIAVESENVLKSDIVANGSSFEKTENSKEQTKDSKEQKFSLNEKKKSNTLISLWQKKEEKCNGVKKDILKNESKGKETSKAAPKNSLMSMFSKQAAKNSEKPPVFKSCEFKNEETSLADVIQHDKSSKRVIQNEDSLKKDKPDQNKKKSQKRKFSNKNSKDSRKNQDSSDSENEFQSKSRKKHRRICTFGSSDSDSEPEEEKEKAQRNFFLPEEPVDIIESTPLTEDEEPIPPTPPVIHSKGRVRIWKTVQKTYEDEDGFLVTKSEKVLVSASEDEEEPIKNSPVKKKDVVNKNVSVNRKQASLMSFFKQK